MRIRRKEGGDTIVEVLFAFAIFSLLVVGGLSLMNQGLAMAQRSLEIDLVRQQIDAQADALRYLNKQYIVDYGKNGQATANWKKLTDQRVDSAPDFNQIIVNGSSCSNWQNLQKVFAIDYHGDRLQTGNFLLKDAGTLMNEVVSYSKIYDETLPGHPQAHSEGLWIQAVSQNPATGNSNGTAQPGFYDFHIRACWQVPGQAAPVTLGTIVRLYEPRT